MTRDISQGDCIDNISKFLTHLTTLQKVVYTAFKSGSLDEFVECLRMFYIAHGLVIRDISSYEGVLGDSELMKYAKIINDIDSELRNDLSELTRGARISFDLIGGNSNGKT